MLQSTSKFRVKEVIYNAGESDAKFALGTGFWDGKPELRLACRWHNPNDPNDLGYPQTFGKPQWFLFPPNIEVKCENLLAPNMKRLTIVLPAGSER